MNIQTLSLQGDRILVFWSDRLVPSVTPFYGKTSREHRWALTIWMLATEPDAILKDDAAVKAHFPPDYDGGKYTINPLNFL